MSTGRHTQRKDSYHSSSTPSLPSLADVVVILVYGYGGVVVKALGHKVSCQVTFLSARLLDLGPLILEPNLDLRFVQAQVLRQILPPLLRQVLVVLELLLQSGQLLRGEGCAGPLLLRLAVTALDATRTWTCDKKERLDWLLFHLPLKH